MKKTLALISLALLILSGCTKGENFDVSMQTWQEFPPEGADTVRSIVKMNSMIDPNLHFQFKYDPALWEVRETNGRYRTAIILNDVNFKDETCYMLPGTIGYEMEDKYEISQWHYMSELTSGIDYEFDNKVTGIQEMRVFETNSNGAGFPTTLFELHLPQDGQDQEKCRKDYEQVIGTYKFESYSGTQEELETKLKELQQLSEDQKKAQEKAQIEELIKQQSAQDAQSEQSEPAS